jgi:hypothetical protein
MATAPVFKLTAQAISKAIITAAMRVHTELVPDYWRARTVRACDMNSKLTATTQPHN